MSMNKKDIIIRLHRGNKTPEEIQSVINILFTEELGFATVKVLFFQKSFNNEYNKFLFIVS